MDQLKEQVYRVAAEAANNAVAAVVKYEGATTNLWSALPIGEQDILWKEARELHTGKKEDPPLPNRGELNGHRKLRETVLHAAFDYLKAVKRPEDKKEGDVRRTSPAEGKPGPGPEPGKPAEAGAPVKPESIKSPATPPGEPIKEADFLKESGKK